jgi:hypothetical protein
VERVELETNATGRTSDREQAKAEKERLKAEKQKEREKERAEKEKDAKKGGSKSGTVPGGPYS